MKKQIMFAVSILALSGTTVNAEFYGKAKVGYGDSNFNQINEIPTMIYGLEAGYQLPTGWLTIGLEKENLTALEKPETSGPFHSGPESLSEFQLDSWNLNLTFSLPNMLKYRPYFMLTYGIVEANIETLMPSAVIYSHTGTSSDPVSWDTDQIKFGFGMDIRVTEKSYFGFEFSYRELGETKQAGSHSVDNARYVAPTNSKSTEISVSFKHLF